MKDYSQYGESKLIYDILNKIGTLNRYAVEFGASDGYWLSNIRMFLEDGWDGLQMEGGPKSGVNGVVNEFITKENINLLFDKYNVPEKFDILSIDIDGNDYWVWREINKTPNIVVIEYNSNFDKNTSVTIEYNAENMFDGSYGYGASFKAMCSLATEKGYYLYAELGFNNLIFVKKEFEKILPPIYNDEYLILPVHQHGQDLRNKKFIQV
jgi:hypothetical protein